MPRERPAGAVRRRIEFDAATWHALHKLSLDSMKSLQERGVSGLAEEASPAAHAQRDVAGEYALAADERPRYARKQARMTGLTADGGGPGGPKEKPAKSLRNTHSRHGWLSRGPV
jgi:hypothetical protein